MNWGRERRHFFADDDDRWALPIMLLVLVFIGYIGGHVGWSIVR